MQRKPAPRIAALLKKTLFDFVQAVITDEILDKLSDNSLTRFSLSVYPRIRHCCLTHGKHCPGAIKIYRRRKGSSG